ncbi:hypothetical protein AWC15_03150 [Mycobacterium lacus]|uniref:Uncharacterized protein n=1 Tax=Mycobacterium lacus TaxID=169765 RepID=A0A1X1Y0M3_9MYCO|nr:DUF5995 family protein [Mycobacterium lacus]MCV7125944.1 hypothetical protein [Mycobacterium lacus]ORW04648.1 hypothetical protein AWC15_03150 [Mycobacterium lacus]BBX96991.1 hypothetical protein MLAC_22850 [Mycobacterium lacus]
MASTAVHSVDDIVEGLQAIIDWSIETASPVGYFAVMYKRSTIAIRGDIDEECSKTNRARADSA